MSGNNFVIKEKPSPGRDIVTLSAVSVLFLMWILPGLIGHDPWKADEPYSFGLVNHILKSGDLVVPTLAGEPFMEKPPLFYITAAGFAKLLSPVLPLHDGARFASGFYILLALVMTGLTARELSDKRTGLIAPLILVSCIGLQNHAHKLITDNALLAGFAVSMYGLALTRRRFALGGFLTGTGIGIGFMSKGLLAPGILGIVMLLLPALFREWRCRGYFYSLVVAFAAVLPWCLAWPWALYERSPQLFSEWLWTQNFGRFLGFTKQGPPNKPALYFYTLPWFAWPAIPVAFWVAWHERKSLLKLDAYRIPLLVFLVMFGVLSLASDGRGLYALPMLIPLTLLAAAGADSMPSGLAKTMDWLGIILCGLAAVILWLGWIAMQTGFPDSVIRKLHAISPGYEPVFNAGIFLTALIYTLVWLYVVFRRDPRSWFITWTAGVTLVWCLMMTLWLPWTDAQRSYRAMITSLKMRIPDQHACVAGLGVGESERAMIEYFGGIVIQRLEVHSNSGCDLLLHAGSPQWLKSSTPGPAWSKLWEGHRDGDERVWFVLYRRDAGSRLFSH